jgi:hypothetical protein
MTYVAPSTVTTLQTYTSAAHNVIVGDIIDHETHLKLACPRRDGVVPAMCKGMRQATYRTSCSNSAFTWNRSNATMWSAGAPDPSHNPNKGPINAHFHKHNTILNRTITPRLQERISRSSKACATKQWPWLTSTISTLILVATDTINRFLLIRQVEVAFIGTDLQLRRVRRPDMLLRSTLPACSATMGVLTTRGNDKCKHEIT